MNWPHAQPFQICLTLSMFDPMRWGAAPDPEVYLAR